MAIGNYGQAGDGSGARTPSTSVNGRILAANTAESIDIPDLAKKVILSATADIGFSFTGTAIVVADSDAEGQSEIIPYGCPVESRTFVIPAAATAISVITEASGGAKVTASFFT